MEQANGQERRAIVESARHGNGSAEGEVGHVYESPEDGRQPHRGAGGIEVGPGSTDVQEAAPKRRVGRPKLEKGEVGRWARSATKWNQSRLQEVIDTLGKHAPALIEKCVERALSDDKDALGYMKICVDRFFPATKAVEVTSLGGKQVAVQILVGTVETHNSVTTVEGEVIE